MNVRQFQTTPDWGKDSFRFLWTNIPAANTPPWDTGGRGRVSKNSHLVLETDFLEADFVALVDCPAPDKHLVSCVP